MKNIVIYVSIAFVVFFWFLSGSVSRAETFVAPNGESYIFCYHYYGNWQYQNFVYNATYYTNLPLAGYNGDFYTSVDGDLIKLALSTNEPGVYTNNLLTFRYNADPSKTIDHCIYVASGQKGYAMRPNPSYPAIQTDIPLFDTEDKLIEWLNTAVVIEYTYNPTIGYLMGIKEKSKFLTIKPSNSNEHYLVETDRVFKFGWDSESSTGIDLKEGADITYFVGDEECYGNISDIQIQSKLHLIGSVRSIWTGKKVRDLPDEGSWHEFSLFDAYDPYSFSFSASDIENYYSSLIQDNSNGITEDVYMKCEYYMRLVGVLSDDDSPPNTTNICGPWVKVSFSAWKFGESDALTDDNIELIGVQKLDENNQDVLDPDSPYGDGQSGSVMSGTGSSVISAENNITVPDASNLDLSLSDFVSQIANVPAVLVSVFSFLPGWVLVFFTLCFGLSCVLIVWKGARGG